MDAAEFIAGTYAEVGGIQECADAIRKAIAKATEDEREGIAGLVEQMLRFADTTSNADQVISQAIRSRGKVE